MCSDLVGRLQFYAWIAGSMAGINVSSWTAPRDVEEGGRRRRDTHATELKDAVRIADDALGSFSTSSMCRKQVNRWYVNGLKKEINLAFLAYDRAENGADELKGFAVITKATRNAEYGFAAEHYFLHLICARQGYGSRLMDSILSSAVEDGSFVALESLMLPFGFYRSKGFILDNGIKDRRSDEVRAHSFTQHEDKDVAILSKEVSLALADLKLATKAWRALMEKAEQRAKGAWHNLLVKAAEKGFPLYGYGYPPPHGNTLLMTWNPTRKNREKYVLHNLKSRYGE